MIAKRTLLALTIVGLIAISVAGQSPSAQKQRSGWSSFIRGAQSAQSSTDYQSASRSYEGVQAREPHVSSEKLKLTGTWLMNIPGTPEAPGFNALQTFSDDGTMTETSDLLAQLAEGPAHGVWTGKKLDYTVTFQLFAFDENHQSVGMIRVRAAIHLTDEDHLTADTVVDFIEPDGTVIPNIGSGPFTGTRIKVVAP